jgi:hypothetical protein
MTAQHHDVQPAPSAALSATPVASDPLGPITLPAQSQVGARALALAGAVGVSAFALTASAGEITWPTILAR